MILDFTGHWRIVDLPTLEEEYVDLSKYIGFVYVMIFDDGSKYIGAKKIWKRITKPPCEFKRGPRKGFEQSDWRTYTSSSNEVNYKIENGIYPKEYLIVGFYDSWGKTLFAEAMLQLEVDIFKNHEEWLNRQIEGHFTRSCFDETININNKYFVECMNSGNINSFTNDIIMEVQYQGKDTKLPINNYINYDDYIKLITGREDEVNDIRLVEEYQRKEWKYRCCDGHKTFLNQTDILNEMNITRKELMEKIKNGSIEENKVETRTIYQKRLSDITFDIDIKRRYD